MILYNDSILSISTENQLIEVYFVISIRVL